jgi:hypothetical protein
MQARGWLVVALASVVVLVGLGGFLLAGRTSSRIGNASAAPDVGRGSVMDPSPPTSPSSIPTVTPNETVSAATPVPGPTRYRTRFVVPTSILVGTDPRSSIEVDSPTFIRFRAWNGLGPSFTIGRPYGLADAAAVLRSFKSHANIRCPGMGHALRARLGDRLGHAFLCAPNERLSSYAFLAFYPWSKEGRDAGSDVSFDEIKDWYVATGKAAPGPYVLIFVTDVARTPVVISVEDAFSTHWRSKQDVPVFPPNAARPVDILGYLAPSDAALLDAVRIGG